MSQGFAIVEVGLGINLETAARTRRGAIINWLLHRRGIDVTPACTDSTVERAWTALRDPDDRCVEIAATIVEPPRPEPEPLVDGKPLAI